MGSEITTGLATPSGSDLDGQGSTSALPLGSWALFFGLAMLMVGNGLNGALIGVRTATDPFGGLQTGVVMAGYFGGFLVAPTVVVGMIATVGHIRVFAGLASLASTVVLVHSVVVSSGVWASMRLVFGFCLAGLYIVIESWLGEMTSPSARGRTMAVYMVVSMGGLGAGQALISLADPSTYRLFVLSSVLVSMSLVPITLAATTRAPEVGVPAPFGLRELARTVPTGIVGSFAAGVGAGLVFGVGAVHAVGVGLSIDLTAAFLIAPTVGAVVFQMPIGRLSDRYSRRGVILAVACAATTIAACGAIWRPVGWAAPLVAFGLGATVFPLYSLVMSYAHDWVPADRVVAASASLIRVNGAGAMVAPLVVAPLVSEVDPSSFHWAFVVALGSVVVFVSWRVVFREPLPRERQMRFVSYPLRATATAMRLVARPGATVTRVRRSPRRGRIG